MSTSLNVNWRHAPCFDLFLKPTCSRPYIIYLSLYLSSAGMLSLFLLLSLAFFQRERRKEQKRGENKQTNNSTYRYTLCKVNSSPIFLLASALRFRFLLLLLLCALCSVLVLCLTCFLFAPLHKALAYAHGICGIKCVWCILWSFAYYYSVAFL